LDLLTSLVDKSLVTYEDRDGEGRYRLLEPVRQFVVERLRQSDEWEAMQNRHRDFFMEWAEEINPKLFLPEQRFWFSRLEAEHNNMRAALAWSVGGEAWGVR